MAFNFSKTTLSLSILCFLISFSEARDHLIGSKSNAWTIPNSEPDSLNHWAEKSRFLTNDSLVFEYNSSVDSVLHVTKRDYVTCNVSSPIETYNGGNVKVKLVRSGPYYFISGAEGHCAKGQKLIVVVMSEKHHRRSEAPAASPAVAPAPSNGVGSLRGGFGVLVLGAVLVVL